MKKSYPGVRMLRQLRKIKDLLIDSINEITIKPRTTVSWKLHVFLFCIAFIIIVSRRPDALFHPQFWAEDGAVFYANAYNLGAIRSLFLPYAGYLHMFPRLIAALAQLFPLLWAPLIFNLSAMVVQILPVNLIISSRFSELIPSFPVRLFLAFLYLSRPSSYEIHANLTNTQWHFALISAMVLLAMPSPFPVWKFFDVGIILLAGLTGPFSVMLFPIALLRWWLCPGKLRMPVILVFGIASLIQGLAIFLSVGNQRGAASFIGLTPEILVRTIGGQIFLSPLIGQRGCENLIIYFPRWYTGISVLAVLIGVYLMLYALLNAPLELRLFIIFSGMIFTAALVSPLTSNWQDLWQPWVGGRYWFVPRLAFVTTLLWLLPLQSPLHLRLIAILAFSIMLIGITWDWQYTPFGNFQFEYYVNKFENLSSGSKIIIPINPQVWYMELIKH